METVTPWDFLVVMKHLCSHIFSTVDSILSNTPKYFHILSLPPILADDIRLWQLKGFSLPFIHPPTLTLLHWIRVWGQVSKVFIFSSPPFSGVHIPIIHESERGKLNFIDTSTLSLPNRLTLLMGLFGKVLSDICET